MLFRESLSAMGYNLISRFLLTFFLLVGSLEILQAKEHLTPKTERLIATTNSLIYSADYSGAQLAISDYLAEENLSLEEQFYGYFLQANINKAMGNPRLAIDLLVDAEQLLVNLETEKRLPYLALSNGSIAECYFNMLHYEKAQQYALKSIAFHPTNRLKDNGHAINHLILGYVHRLEEEYEQASDYYNKAANSYRSTQNSCDLPLCYLKIADLHLAKEEFSQANRYIDRALVLSDSCKIDQYILLCQLTRVTFWEKQGRYKESLTALREVERFRQRLAQQKQSEVVNELQIKHQTALTEEENKRLRDQALFVRQNTRFKFLLLTGFIVGLFLLLLFGLLLLRIRRQKNTALEEQLEHINAQNKEREALLKEVHHRVKNNMQVITSLLHLQANDPSKAQQDRTRLFQSSQSRINAMALVHELLYQSNDVSNISLATYVEDLVKSLRTDFQQSHQEIDLDLQIPVIYLGLDTAIPLGLLLNEILSNSLLHGLSKRSKGKIYVKVMPLEGNRYQLLIGDDGIGLEEHTNLSQKQSLGFSLIRKLIRQLQGKLELLEKPAGCHYAIEFTAID